MKNNNNNTELMLTSDVFILNSQYILAQFQTNN